MQEIDNPELTSPASNIIDVDMNSFVSEVIERSMQVPVIVDFWAPWCEPCKTLGPIIEKVISDANGAAILAKVNIDEAQEIAAQMQIRSVPTVVAFVGGRPVDAFAGVKSESEIKEFLQKIAPDLGPSESDQMLEAAAMAYEQKQYDHAGAAYSQVLQIDPSNTQATAGLANCLIKLGDLENAEQVLSGAEKKDDPDISAALANLDMAKQLGEIGDVDALKTNVEQDSTDNQARFDLALALWAIGDHVEAADHLLYIIENDKEWQDDGARKQLLKFFEMAGPMDPFTVSARRKLSSLLFS